MAPFRSLSRSKVILLLSALMVFVLFQNMGSLQNQETPVWKKKGAGFSLWQEISRETFNQSPGYHEESAQAAAERLRALNVSWYYTWDPEPLSRVGELATDPVFYPMIYRNKPNEAHSIFKYPLSVENQIERAKSHRPVKGYRYVLLYNEPDNSTSDHPFQHPVDGAKAINTNVRGLASLAQHVGAPAMAINYDSNRSWYSQMNEQQLRAMRGKPLPWLKVFNNNSSADLKKMMLGPKGRTVVPVHIYPDPFATGVVKTAEDLALGSPLRIHAKRAVINRVTRFLQDVRREYDAQIMITEFNIADWATKWDPENNPVNRIPEDFVVEVMKDLLPEISSLSYVTHYALFTNSVDYGENLRTAASFTSYFDIDSKGRKKRRSSVELTELGRLYAEFTDVRCQKGEFKSGDKFVEFFSKECGSPTRFGWENKDRNGWYWDTKASQWRRILTIEQAGYFQDHGMQFPTANRTLQTCYHGRYFFDQKLIEYKSLACPHNENEPGWRTVNQERQKTLDYQNTKVGIIGYYFE